MLQLPTHRVCKGCRHRLEMNDSNFYPFRNKNGKTYYSSRCRTCHRRQTMERKKVLRGKGACLDCGQPVGLNIEGKRTAYCEICRGNREARRRRKVGNPGLVKTLEHFEMLAQTLGVPFMLGPRDIDVLAYDQVDGEPIDNELRDGNYSRWPHAVPLDDTKGFVPGNIVVMAKATHDKLIEGARNEATRKLALETIHQANMIWLGRL